MKIKSSCIVFVLLTTFLVLLLNLKLQYNGGPDYGDVLSYGSIARSISLGYGIVQNTTAPAVLAKLGHYPIMDLMQPLGFYLVEGVLFKIFGASENTIVGISFVFTLLWLAMIWIWSQTLTLKPITAFSVYGILLLSPFLLTFSYSGLTEPFYTFLFLSTLYLYFFKPVSRPLFFALGALAMFAAITRPSSIFYTPAVAWLLVTDARIKQKRSILFYALAGMILVKLPFLIRQQIYQAHDNSLWSSFQEILLQFNKTEFYALLRSSQPDWSVIPNLNNVGSYLIPVMIRTVKNFFNLGSSLLLHAPGSQWVFLLFPLTIFVLPKDAQRRRLCIFTFILFVSSYLGFSFAWPQNRYFFPILPLLTLCLGFSSEEFFARNPNVKCGKFNHAIALVALLVGAHWLNSQRQAFTNPPATNKWLYMKKFISDNIPPRATIVTNHYSILSWYAGADRRAILYPNHLDEINYIHQNYTNVDAVLLTDELTWLLPSGAEWSDILNQPPKQLAENYMLKAVYQDNRSKAVLYLRAAKAGQ
jgi:hypothetical protein